MELRTGIVGSGLRRSDRCLHYVTNSTGRRVLDCIRTAIPGLSHCDQHRRVGDKSRVLVEADLVQYDLEYEERLADDITSREVDQLIQSILRRYRQCKRSNSNVLLRDRIERWLDEANNIESLMNDDVVEVIGDSDEDFIQEEIEYDSDASVILYSDNE